MQHGQRSGILGLALRRDRSACEEGGGSARPCHLVVSPAAEPCFTPPSGNGTSIGATTTLARPSCRSSPISRAVAGDRSMIRPFTYGPRSWIVTSALWPVSRFVTFAVVPSGSVLLAALAALGFMRVPSAI